MSRQPAPEFYQGDDPGEFLTQVAEYLAEPSRRRMGETTEAYVKEAVMELRLGPLKESLKQAAMQPIEDFPAHVLGDIKDTLRDLLARVEGQS